MCVCVSVKMHIYICVCVFERAHACERAHMYERTYVYKCVHTHVCVRVRESLCEYTHTYTEYQPEILTFSAIFSSSNIIQ